jgi:hypothetical protein
MRLFLYALSGDAPPDLVPRLFKERAPSGRVLDSMPEPDELPGWLGDADLNEYARAYARTGFRGPLGVYRNQDRDWHEHPEIGTAGVRQPALFIGGRRDPAVLHATRPHEDVDLMHMEPESHKRLQSGS